MFHSLGHGILAGTQTDRLQNLGRAARVVKMMWRRSWYDDGGNTMPGTSNTTTELFVTTGSGTMAVCLFRSFLPQNVFAVHETGSASSEILKHVKAMLVP